ncbi:hypothetical protein Tco_1507564 [Tanacetum coccineum]
MTLGELGEIIREVFVKLLLKSSGKLSIRIVVLERYRLKAVGGLLVVSVTVSLLWMISSEPWTVSLLWIVSSERDRLIAFEISSWRGARVDVRTYLLGGAMISSEANGIVRDSQVVGENWLLRHKLRWYATRRSCKVRVGSNGNLLWEASVLLGRKKGGVRVAREDDRRVSEGREDVREVFQQRGSGAKRKLSRCGRNQMGNEPILALPEGADDFVVYYDARSKDLEACLEKGEVNNRWLSMKKDIASCGSKYLAYSEVEVEYQGSSGLLLQPELPE